MPAAATALGAGDDLPSPANPQMASSADLVTTSSGDGAIASERIERPEPGLARGRWEAPPYVFYGVAAATLVGGVTLAIRAIRDLRRPRR